MADNVSITPGAGSTVATDDVGGAQHQRVKPTWGTNGVGNDVNEITPLPVALYSGGAAVSPDLFYGTDALITISLGGLANAGWRQSLVVDNQTNKYTDALVSGRIRTGAVAPTPATAITLYVYAYVNSATYSGGASGLDAAYTANGRETQLTVAQLHAITVDADTSVDYAFPPRSVCEALNVPVLPKKWGIVVRNEIGQALDATAGNHVTTYYGLR